MAHWVKDLVLSLQKLGLLLWHRFDSYRTPRPGTAMPQAGPKKKKKKGKKKDRKKIEIVAFKVFNK